MNRQRVLVTGGTSGIGRAVAEAMLKQGARVVVGSLGNDSDRMALKRLQAQGECHQVVGDLSEVGVPKRVVREAAQLLGGLDTLVNNAGTFADVDFLDIDETHFARTFDLNVRGYFFAAQEFARQIRQGEPRTFDASIICMGSTNSLQAEKGGVLYDTSKGAVLMLVRSLAVTLSDFGIRVNGIGPGIIKTPLTSNGHADLPDVVNGLQAQIPVGRIGEAEDVAGAAVFLASKAARYITGQMLYVDGGIVAQQMTWSLPTA